MRHNAFQPIFCIILSITCTISVDIAITCTDPWGPVGTHTSEVSCAAGETMVSCGYKGAHQIIGSIADTTTNVCTAFDHSLTGYNISAVARCCTFPTDAQITTSTIQSSASESASVQCPEGSILTGCTQYLASGDGNAIKGAFSGVQSSPPQTDAWISTGNQCNAEGQSGNTVQATARCLSINDPHYRYTLTCETKAAYTNYGDFGACQSGLQMMACAGFSEEGGLDRHYVTSNDTCFVGKDNETVHYANAICCQMTFSALMTIDPSDPLQINDVITITGVGFDDTALSVQFWDGSDIAFNYDLY